MGSGRESFLPKSFMNVLDRPHIQMKVPGICNLNRVLAITHLLVAKDIVGFLDPHEGSLSVTHVVVLVDFFVSQPRDFIKTS